jgi:hypothetical protein
MSPPGIYSGRQSHMVVQCTSLFLLTFLTKSLDKGQRRAETVVLNIPDAEWKSQNEKSCSDVIMLAGGSTRVTPNRSRLPDVVLKSQVLGDFAQTEAI